MAEKRSGTSAYRCPACKMLQNKPFDECPQCGVIVSRYLKLHGGSKLEETPTEIVTQPVSLFTPTMVVERPAFTPEPQPQTEDWTPPEQTEVEYVPFDPLAPRPAPSETQSLAVSQAPSPHPAPTPPPKRRAPIKPRELADDILAGMIEAEIMAKYGLTGEELLTVIEKLVALDLVKPWDVLDRIAFIEDSLASGHKRITPRYRIAVHVSIHSVHDPETCGSVVDVSDAGLGIEGLLCEQGVTETFAITRTKGGETVEIFFDGECRWTRIDSKSRMPLAGLRVTRISRSNLKKLRDLIRELIGR